MDKHVGSYSLKLCVFEHLLVYLQFFLKVHFNILTFDIMLRRYIGCCYFVMVYV